MATTDEFSIEWEVEDGYAGGRRPQTCDVNADMLDYEMLDDDLEELYNDIIMEEFMQNISGNGTNLEAFQAWAKQALAARKEEDDE